MADRSTVTSGSSPAIAVKLPSGLGDVLEQLQATCRKLDIQKPDPGKFYKYFKDRVPTRAFVDLFSAVVTETGFGKGLFDDRPELLEIKTKESREDRRRDNRREFFTRISVAVDLFLRRPIGSWDIGLIKSSGSAGATPMGILSTLQLLLCVVQRLYLLTF